MKDIWVQQNERHMDTIKWKTWNNKMKDMKQQNERLRVKQNERHMSTTKWKTYVYNKMKDICIQQNERQMYTTKWKTYVNNKMLP